MILSNTFRTPLRIYLEASYPDDVHEARVVSAFQFLGLIWLLVLLVPLLFIVPASAFGFEKLNAGKLVGPDGWRVLAVSGEFSVSSFTEYVYVGYGPHDEKSLDILALNYLWRDRVPVSFSRRQHPSNIDGCGYFAQSRFNCFDSRGSSAWIVHTKLGTNVARQCEQGHPVSYSQIGAIQANQGYPLSLAAFFGNSHGFTKDRGLSPLDPEPDAESF